MGTEGQTPLTVEHRRVLQAAFHRQPFRPSIVEWALAECCVDRGWLEVIVSPADDPVVLPSAGYNLTPLGLARLAGEA